MDTNKNIHIVYFSPVFHTRELARTVASVLAGQLGLNPPIEHDITPFSSDNDRMIFTSEDITVLAAPVYGGRVPAPAVERFKGVAGNGSRAILLVSYGNREFEDALLELGDMAGECGFKNIAGAACIAQHTLAPDCATGRPDKADIDSITVFANSLASLIKNNVKLQAPALPGKHPYRQFKSFPLPQTVDFNCEHCGLCAEQCPCMAINFENQSIVDPAKCICCMRCVNICPARARHPDPIFLNRISEKLAPLCVNRKENRFFIQSHA